MATYGTQDEGNQTHNTTRAGHHYGQINTNNVNQTSPPPTNNWS